jgi:hypothetical protein
MMLTRGGGAGRGDYDCVHLYCVDLYCVYSFREKRVRG